MSLDINSKEKKVTVHINRDPNSAFDFSGAENEARPLSGALARSAAVNRIRRTGNGMAVSSGAAKIKSPQFKSMPNIKPVSNNNFKLNF